LRSTVCDKLEANRDHRLDMNPGRNDPCPCGSGKKYKHCCLRNESAAVETAEVFLRRRVRAAIDDLAAQLLRFVRNQLGERLIDEAWAEFTGTEDAFDPETQHLPVFMPWFFYGWSPDPHDTEFPELAARGATVAGEFLARRSRHLTTLLVRYLEACAAAAFSFHEVVRVEADHGFVLRDVLLDRETFVVEHSASRSVGPGDILFAQIVVVDGLALLDGCAPVVLQPGYMPEIVELRKRVRAKGDLFGELLLKEWDIELIDLYLDLAERTLRPSMPVLQNTDGEPLEPHALVFRVEDAEAAITALDTAQLVNDETIQPDEVRRNRHGRLIEASWRWQRAGNAMHKSWDNTSLGHLTLKDTTLKLEVNSAGRAARGRSVVEDVLAGNASYRATKIESLDSMLAETKDHPTPSADREHERLAQLPEVRQHLNEMLMRHYSDWLESKLPALGERTPREAVRDRDGREAVAGLIAQIERDGARHSPPLDAEITAMLRRELGLA
jgi:SEC-C motif-containing protein